MSTWLAKLRARLGESSQFGKERFRRRRSSSGRIRDFGVSRHRRVASTRRFRRVLRSVNEISVSENLGSLSKRNSRRRSASEESRGRASSCICLYLSLSLSLSSRSQVNRDSAQLRTLSSFWKYSRRKEIGLSGRPTHSCTIQSFRTCWILCLCTYSSHSRKLCSSSRFAAILMMHGAPLYRRYVGPSPPPPPHPTDPPPSLAITFVISEKHRGVPDDENMQKRLRDDRFPWRSFVHRKKRIS